MRFVFAYHPEKGGVAFMATGVYADQGAHQTVLNGKVTNTSPGTPKQITTNNTGVHSVVIRALASNSGKVYVGNSTVSSANGVQLAAGDSLTIVVGNLALIYFDTDNNGEGLTYIGT